MAYTTAFAFSAPTGLTLEAQFKTTAGADSGTPVTTGFYEAGNGWYGWSGSIADDFRGYLIFRPSGGGTVHAFFAVNPFETEKVTLDMAQSVPVADLSAKTTQNVGDCLSAARADGAGGLAIVGTTMTAKGPNNETVRTFTLDSSSNPTQRS